MIHRQSITLEGTVQGIGFRPLVYRLATELGLTGNVLNDGRGVTVELQGPSDALARFKQRLYDELPPAGRVDGWADRPIPCLDEETEFQISASEASGDTAMSLAPDLVVCDACLKELFDPADRRYGYPFINCTHCGPRYTIATALPYDRVSTTMRQFEMCDACRAEYRDPLDRRYHAQPIACPKCGPRMWLAPEDETLDSNWVIERAATRLARGQIVAVKGIGGFHLTVDAMDPVAVGRLRELKHRRRKPLAVMVRDLAGAHGLVELSDEAEALLTSPPAPIVIAPAKKGVVIREWIAPELGEIGVMLPYTPLHRLLMAAGPAVVVMTSGNRSAEPMIKDNDTAQSELVADAYLLHDRPIATAVDDSVIRSTPVGPVFVRRSRGYVPRPLVAPALPDRPILALGAELKVTVSTLNKGEIVVGRHLGDLNNLPAEEAFHREVERVLRFSRMTPQAVAVDRHPDLASVAFAEERFADLPLIRVQHHHAHFSSVLVEHRIEPNRRAVGIILDGMGYGTDHRSWGGEVLCGSYGGVERYGQLRYVPLPGGDRAALQPARMATSLLVDAGIGRPGMVGYDERIAEIVRLPSVSPLTSSAGRLFDGVAALLGIAPKIQAFEGEAAARLEALSDQSCTDAYPLPLDGTQLDTRILVQALVGDSSPNPIRAARFHNGLADGLIHLASMADEALVVLGGGCLVNGLLARRLIDGLTRKGCTVLRPKELPPGDGGLSAGQAACAACMI